MARISGQKKEELFLFLKLLLSLLTYMHTRQCLMPVLPWKHMLQGAPCLSRAAEGCDAQLPWPCRAGILLLELLGAAALGSLRALNSDGLSTTPLHCWALQCPILAGLAAFEANEPIFITDFTRWLKCHIPSSACKRLQMQIRPQHPEIPEREKLCSPITQTHLTAFWNKS